MSALFKQEIARQISALSGVQTDKVLEAIAPPRLAEHGDFAVAVPRLRLPGNPTATATDLASRMEKNELLTAISCQGPFINIFINKQRLMQLTLKQVFETRETFGQNNSGAGKRVLVEYSSPNIAKPFHAGHLRGTIIGNYVVNVLKANGYKTISMNYLGDWGKQYGLLAVGYQELGLGDDAKLKEDPIQHLFEVYVAVNKAAEVDPAIHDAARAYFKRMEDGDVQALQLWQRFRDLSIVRYKDTYSRLGVSFDVYSGESQVNEATSRAANMLTESGLLQDSDGAKIINLEQYKLGTTVITRSDGTPLYLTRDVGAAIARDEEFHFDKMIYVVGNQQDQHLTQLFKILELIGLEDLSKRCEHINYGMVKGMATRKGEVKFLDDILNETREKAHNQMKKNPVKYAQIEDPEYVSDIVGMSAVIIQDFGARRIKDYEFNMERNLSFEGDTGPYLQYTHARLCSIERNSDISVSLNVDLSLLTESCVADIIKLIDQYPEQVYQAAETLEPRRHSLRSCWKLNQTLVT
ncbi:arginyl-tRNA synthetase [Ramicandelaber brevisporus]|nr:arginyl-tRNA synthetase [Ramicandelaber brevisporus]